MTMKLVWHLIALAATGTTSLAATNEELLKQLDFNRNGALEDIEIKAGLKYKLSGGTLDVTKISAADISGAAVQRMWFNFTLNHGTKQRYAFSEVDSKRDFGLTKVFTSGPTAEEVNSQPTIRKSEFKIRRDKDDLKKDITDADIKGALFSYGRNFNTDNDQWIARGILDYDYTVYNNTAGGAFDSAHLELTSEFNRVSTGGEVRETAPNPSFESKEINSLVFGANLHMLFKRANPGDPLDPSTPANFYAGTVIDLSGEWRTDFDFNTSVPMVTLDIAPIFSGIGMQSLNQKISWLFFRWSLALHIEGGKVSRTGPGTSLPMDTTIGRIGPHVTLDLLPFPDLFDSRLVLGLSFFQYEPFTANAQESRLLKASASYYFFVPTAAVEQEKPTGPKTLRDARVALTLEYTNGEVPDKTPRDNTLILGVGFAF